MQITPMVGSTTFTANDEEHTLGVRYNLREWAERHPYGSTTASEQMSEVEDEAWRLDGKDVTDDELYDRFGVAAMKDPMQVAIDNGVDIELEPSSHDPE